MDFVVVCFDVVNILVYVVGYGRLYDFLFFWIVINYIFGIYLFVKEWYYLCEILVGIVGGMMNVVMDNVKVYVFCVENDFRIMRV